MHNPQELAALRRDIRRTTEDHLIRSLDDRDRHHLAQDVPSLLDTATAALLQDLLAYARRDPASPDPRLILTSSACFSAVVHYRLAHGVYRLQDPSLRPCALRIANIARRTTGCEIHPAAVIAPGFVVDHGYGVVIGETTRVGADCYLLNGVVLGARGIADNPAGRRHPTLGAGVQVGANARILGPIRIGDGAFVAPGAVVTTDIGPKARVTVVNQLQVSTHPGAPNAVLAHVDDGDLSVHCEHVERYDITIVDASYAEIHALQLRLLARTSTNMRFTLLAQPAPRPEHPQLPFHLRLLPTDGEAFYLLNPPGLTSLAQQVLDSPLQ